MVDCGRGLIRSSTVAGSGSLLAEPWVGTVGGIVAILERSG